MPATRKVADPGLPNLLYSLSAVACTCSWLSLVQLAPCRRFPTADDGCSSFPCLTFVAVALYSSSGAEPGVSSWCPVLQLFSLFAIVSTAIAAPAYMCDAEKTWTTVFASVGLGTMLFAGHVRSQPECSYWFMLLADGLQTNAAGRVLRWAWTPPATEAGLKTGAAACYIIDPGTRVAIAAAAAATLLGTVMPTTMQLVLIVACAWAVACSACLHAEAVHRGLRDSALDAGASDIDELLSYSIG